VVVCSVGEPRAATRAAPYAALLPTDLSYGHVCGLLFTPVQVVTVSLGPDLPGPESTEPPFVLSLLPTGSPAKVQLDSGPAAT
jgi:hypothetical protein